MTTTEKRLNTLRISIFLVLTFVLTYIAEFVLWRNGGLMNPKVQLYLMLIMLIPAFCTLLARRMTGEGMQNLWLRPHFKANRWTYLIAWIGPGLLIVFGGILYFLIFPNQFDPELTVLRNSIAVLSPEQAESLTKTQIGYSALSQFVMALLLAPILNFIPCLGEELGWRGYLLPKLAALMGKKRAVLLSGVIWGLWHAPIIAMGYNYGTGYPGFPWLGIGAMILFCLFVGSFFSWLTFRIPSAVPAIIAHGALNGMASISMLFMKGTPNPFIGPFPIGVIGGAGFILVGILCWIKLDEIKQPEVL